MHPGTGLRTGGAALGKEPFHSLQGAYDADRDTHRLTTAVKEW